MAHIKKISILLLLLINAFTIFHFEIALDVLIIFLVLLSSASIGSFFKPKTSSVNKLFVQLSLGLGINSVALLLLTLGHFVNSLIIWTYLSITFLISNKNIIQTFKKWILLTTISARKYFGIIYIFLLFLPIYIARSASPIRTYDSLSKHLAIPTRILETGGFDFNVIESLVFGDFALGSHMLFLFVQGLGGHKALVLINVVISYLLLIFILRLANSIFSNYLYSCVIALIYLSTPIFFTLSTNLGTDVICSLFCLAPLLLLGDLSPNTLAKNSIYISFLLGVSFLNKPHSIYIIIPTLVGILLIITLNGNKSHLEKLPSLIIKNILALILPFMPSLLMAWYKTGNPVFPFANSIFKSPFFTNTDFVDPFNSNPFTYKILDEIVYHTEKHIEHFDRGFGEFLILAYLCPIYLLIKDISKRRVLALLGILFIGFTLATRVTFNVRYYISLIYLALPVCLYFVFFIFLKISFKRIGLLLTTIVCTYLISQNLILLLAPHNFWGFNKTYLVKNIELSEFPTKEFLKLIDKKDVRIFAPDDVFRGEMKAEIYGLTWYNTFILQQLIEKKVEPQSLLYSFDYYLEDKNGKYKNMYLNTIQLDKFSLIKENQTHRLYKIPRVYPSFLDTLYNDYYKFIKTRRLPKGP